MTKPVTRKMAVDCLLWQFFLGENIRIDMLFSAGVRFVCPICKEDIQEGQDIQFDHIHADVHDGPHEYQNLRPLHKECHKIKTKADVQANAKVRRLTGQNKPKIKKRIPTRSFPPKGSVKFARKK